MRGIRPASISALVEIIKQIGVMMKPDSWDAWQNKVLSDLKELKTDMNTTKKEVHQIKTSIEVLKLKSTFFGTIGGALPMIAYFFYEVVKK